MKSTKDSTPKTRGGWRTFNMDVQVYSSSIRYIVSTSFFLGLRWMLRCWYCLNILSRVWFFHKIMFRYHHYYVVSLFWWNLSLNLVSLLKMLVLKCLIFRIKVCKSIWKLNNEENTTCILQIFTLRIGHFNANIFDKLSRI